MNRKRREVLSWCFFDFANSSFTTVVITVVFSAYFAGVIAKEDGSLLWNLGLTISNVIIVLTAPIIGAVADISSRKKRFLFVSYVTCVVATAMLFFAEEGMVVYALVAFIVANVAFASGENLVAGFLPDIAEPEEMSRVSALGWGIGYMGGLGALALSLPLALAETEGDATIRATNLVVAGFFLIGGIPTFLWVKERRRSDGDRPLGPAIRQGYRQVLETLKTRHEHPELFRFLGAYLIFSIGIYGVIGNASIYATQIYGLQQDDVILIFMVSQVTAAAGALLSGYLAQRHGSVFTVKLMVVVWLACGATALLSRGTTLEFWVVAVLAGFAMGGAFAASRAVVGCLAPEGQGGESFGYWGLASRLAAVLAAGGNTLCIYVSDGLRFGIAYFTASFVLGLFLLRGGFKSGRAETTAR